MLTAKEAVKIYRKRVKLNKPTLEYCLNIIEKVADSADRYYLFYDLDKSIVKNLKKIRIYDRFK